MIKNEYGTIVKSLAGHDRNQYYVLIDSDDINVYIVDGKSRALDKPKRKNRKHVQLTKTKIFDGYSDKSIHIPITNEFVKRKLKEYKNNQE